MQDRLATITAPFEPISLAELNARASLQTRADNKYFVPWETYAEFMHELQKTYVMLEIDKQRAFTYDSQYFDTTAFETYWTHMQGRRKRFKCRSRIYVDSGLCMFEVKLKSGRGETIKHRISYSENDFHHVTPQAEAFLKDCLGTAYKIEYTQQLVPSIRTYYRRVTLMSEDAMERITCDSDLGFAMNDEWQGYMSSDHVLIEAKSALGRGSADQLLWRMGVRPASGSKYCLGLSLARPEFRNNPFRSERNAFFIQNAASAVAAPVAEHAAEVFVHSAAETHSPSLAPMPSPAAMLAS